MVQIRRGRQGHRIIFKLLTGREIEGSGRVGDEVGEPGEVVSPEDEMVEADPRHQASLQALLLAVCEPGELHEVVLSEVGNSLPPDQVEVTLSADCPLHWLLGH